MTDREMAFGAVVDRQGRFLYRVALGLMRNPEDAEDVVQEALLKLFRGEGWREMSDERAFLARVVWRVGLDRIAARRVHMDVTEMEVAATGETVEDAMVGEGERAVLRRLIEGLPEELRRPLVLSAIEEMTSREVGVAMGIPEATVRGRVMRARAELKRRFEAMQRLRAEVAR
ncbi:RNA polymerase sigma factor [Granulicella pectinivorans]|uniref:RNA polymerase sigma factor n=1 Tax=Granulicella pectinivorans TaxID=474950 RepID=UPI001FEC35B0|nr:RNA polymerase sigma factor [Granulicella pectinivorans]